MSVLQITSSQAEGLACKALIALPMRFLSKG